MELTAIQSRVKLRSMRSISGGGGVTGVLYILFARPTADVTPTLRRGEEIVCLERAVRGVDMVAEVGAVLAAVSAATIVCI